MTSITLAEAGSVIEEASHMKNDSALNYQALSSVFFEDKKSNKSHLAPYLGL